MTSEPEANRLKLKILVCCALLALVVLPGFLAAQGNVPSIPVGNPPTLQGGQALPLPSSEAQARPTSEFPPAPPGLEQIAPSSPPATAAKPAARSTASTPPGSLVQMQFDNIELRDLIKFVSNIMGKNFIFDESVVRGRVTILSPRSLTKDEVFRVFESVLHYNGFSVVETPEAFKVVKIADAKTMAVESFTKKTLPRGAGQEVISTLVYPLEYLDANSMVGILRPLLGRDADIILISNVGTEESRPHAKIGVYNNAQTTTITTAGVYYKAVFTNGSFYTTKMTLTNNKMLYQSSIIRDGMMWVSGSIAVNGTNRNLDACIRRGVAVSTVTGGATLATVVTSVNHNMSSGQQVQMLGCTVATYNGVKTITVVDSKTFTYPNTSNSGVVTGSATCGNLMGPVSIRTGTSGQPVVFSTNCYVEDMVKNGYSEIYVTSANSGDAITVSDVTWLFNTV